MIMPRILEGLRSDLQAPLCTALLSAAACQVMQQADRTAFIIALYSVDRSDCCFEIWGGRLV